MPFTVWDGSIKKKKTNEGPSLKLYNLVYLIVRTCFSKKNLFDS